MLKNLFKKKPSIELINTHEADVVLRLMFEIAISDGKLDSAELKMIRRRANKIASEDVNETHSIEEKKELLKVLWELVTADSVIDAYEENLYFKIAELIKIKRSIANQIKQENP